jgi:catechol 2,3-dioxygenase-like lactoylglutathione lyase family enzyme
LDFAKPELDVVLVTPDAAAARRFYVEVLGFDDCGEATDVDGESHVVVGWGAQRIFLRERCGLGERSPGALYAGLGYRVLGLFVFDMEGICSRIRAQGRRVAEGIELPGQLQLRFAKDADGNMLELIGLLNPPADLASIRDRIQVGMTVSDVEDTRAFYAGCLGLPEQAPTPIDAESIRYAVTAGSSTLKYWQREITPPNTAGPPETAIGIRSVTLHVADLAAALREISIPPVRVAPERGVAWLADPDGNWLALRESS